MGVLYREAEDVQSLLIPFLRERGSTMAETEIVAKARALSLGRITTGEFWRSAGLEDDHAQLDTDYLARHQLTPGVIRYLRSLRDRGVRIALFDQRCDQLGDPAAITTQSRRAHRPVGHQCVGRRPQARQAHLRSPAADDG